ncbi:MAG: sirohydrochlorin nickelochelatase [Methanothermobacter sp.]
MNRDLNSQEDETGVILVGHGSRLPYGKEVLTEMAEIYKEDSQYPVEIGFMNMNEPSIPAAINKLAEKGVTKIIVTPVFIAHGVHTKQDIPHILGLDDGKEPSHHHHDEEHEDIKFNGQIIYTEPIGADSRIVDIVKERINGAC